MSFIGVDGLAWIPACAGTTEGKNWKRQGVKIRVMQSIRCT